MMPNLPQICARLDHQHVQYTVDDGYCPAENLSIGRNGFNRHVIQVHYPYITGFPLLIFAHSQHGLTDFLICCPIHHLRFFRAGGFRSMMRYGVPPLF
jgi:hypothetical protein